MNPFLRELLASHESRGAKVYSLNVMDNTFDLEWVKGNFRKLVDGNKFTTYYFHNNDAYKAGARGAAISYGLCLMVG